MAPRRFSEMKLLPIKVTIVPSRFLLIILHKLQVSHGYKFIGNKGKYFRYFRPRKLNEAILLEIEHARMQGSISANIFSSFFNFIVITSVDNYYNMLEIFRKGFSRGKVEMKRKKKKNTLLITLVIQDEDIILHEIYPRVRVNTLEIT